MRTTASLRKHRIQVSAPGKLILFGEHAVVYGKQALATSLTDLRTFVTLSHHDHHHHHDDVNNAIDVNNDDDNNNNNGSFAIDAPSIGLHHFQIPLIRVKSLWREWCSTRGDGDGDDDTARLDNALLDRLYTLADELVPKEEEGERHGDEEMEGELRRSQRIVSVVCCLYLFLYLGKDVNEDDDIRMDVRTTFPIGAGLGSSAALCVCIAASMLIYHGLLSPIEEDSGDTAHTRFEMIMPSEGEVMGTKDSIGIMRDEESLSLINSWAFVLEQIIHGTPSGIDNAVGTFGGVLTMCRRDGEVHIQRVANVPDILKILIVNTKVPRNTKQVVTKVRERRDREMDHMDRIMDSVERCSEACLSLFKSYCTGECDSVQFFNDMEMLIDTNQQLLNEMGVGHRQLDRVVEIAKSHGLHAKLTGAGAGGCAFVLLRDTTSSEMVAKLRNDMEQQGFECYETRIASHGVLLHSTK